MEFSKARARLVNAVKRCNRSQVDRQPALRPENRLACPTLFWLPGYSFSLVYYIMLYYVRLYRKYVHKVLYYTVEPLLHVGTRRPLDLSAEAEHHSKPPPPSLNPNP